MLIKRAFRMPNFSTPGSFFSSSAVRARRTWPLILSYKETSANSPNPLSCNHEATTFGVQVAGSPDADCKTTAINSGYLTII